MRAPQRGHAVYLEIGSKRTFAGALEWPGWCRSGRDEDQALQALVEYASRYEAALGQAARGFQAPGDGASLEVVERLRGGSGTDFGVPSVAPAGDERPLDNAELERLTGLLEASWAAFDRTAENAVGKELRKGPRGGGRDLDKIIAHVLEADWAYLGEIGGRYRAPGETDRATRMSQVRGAILEALGARAHGEPPPPSRRTRPLWTPRYGVRRSVWHALDHAWEIEDRATPA